MRKFFPVDELARDERFHQINMRQAQLDPRSEIVSQAQRGDSGKQSRRSRTNRLTPQRAEASEAARALMHGIFVGEIQALEGAGRTCHDFETNVEAPFALKLDMARQAWDEARHVEISVKLSEWMGSEIGRASCRERVLDHV